MIKFFVIVLSICFVTPCISQEIVNHNGVDGYWFREEVGDQILKDLENYSLTKELLPLLEKKNELLETRLGILDQLVKVDGDIIKGQDKQIQDQQKQINIVKEENKKLIEKADKWYNKKLLWVGVGAVAGIAVTIAGGVVIGKAF